MFAPTDAVELVLTQLLGKEAKQDVERIQRAWDYYYGETPNMIEAADGVDDNVRLNVVQICVDAATDYLFGERLPMTLDGEDEAQAWLDAVWESSGGMGLLQDARTNGAIAGTAWLKLQMPPEGESVRTTLPRIRTLNPSSVEVLTDEDDYERVLEYRVTWVARDDRGRLVTRRERWLRDGSVWQYLKEQAASNDRFRVVDSAVWGWPFPPVFCCKNLPAPNEFGGRPDVTTDLMNLQDAINGTASDARHISRLLGHPQLWFAGVDAQQLTAKPGEALLLPDEAKGGVLSPGAAPGGHLALIEALKAVYHEQSRVPEIAAGRLDNVGQLSGLALRILYGPLQRRTATQRRLYGDGLISEVNAALLALAEYEPATTVLAWPDNLPQDEGELAKDAQDKQRAGVSMRTTLGELGYDPDAEEDRRKDEADERAQGVAGALAQFDMR